MVYRDNKTAGHRYSPGLIGLQEVKGSMKNCHALALRNKKPNGAKCFAGLLTDQFERPVHSTNRAIVFGNEWKLLSRKTMRIGPGRVGREFWGTNYDRDLYEALLQHKASGLKVRFYDTHFWPGKEKKKWVRKVQAKDLVKLVKKRAQYGELPPILVGDFNYTANEDSERIINQYFKVAARESIDVVYVGRPSIFTKAHGKITVKNPSRNLILKDHTYNTKEFSDHNSPGALLQLSECGCSVGERRKCPSDARAYQKCDGCNYTGVCWSTSHAPGGTPGGIPKGEPSIPPGGDAN